MKSRPLFQLKRGHFKAIEFNGVSAEPAHISDPSWFRQWKSIFAVGCLNRARGAEMMTVRQVVALLRG